MAEIYAAKSAVRERNDIKRARKGARRRRDWRKETICCAVVFDSDMGVQDNQWVWPCSLVRSSDRYAMVATGGDWLYVNGRK